MSNISFPILIDCLEGYLYCKNRGYEPLVDNRFIIPISLRLKLQYELFGNASPENDVKYYRWVWNNKVHSCEETGHPLHNYSSAFVSHILSRGANTEMRYDARNNNLVKLEVHNIWDRGTEEQKMRLKIYYKNIPIIQILKKEYNET